LRIKGLLVHLDMEKDDVKYYDWSEDEEFVAELNERVRRWEEGTDALVSLEEYKAQISQLDKERAKSLDGYNKELDESEAQIDAGDYYTQDEVKKILEDRRMRR